MIVCVLTTSHTQYTSDSSICIFLFNRTTLTVFVTYRTGALYVHRLWFYRHQHDNRVRSELFVAYQRWWFQWRFWFVPSVPGYTRTLSLETVHTTFEWNCQMVVVYRIWCGIAAGQLYPDNQNKPVFWMCVCSYSYTACIAYAPYSYLWPVCLYYIFPHYFINATVFGEGGGSWTQNVCFYFPHKVCLKHFSF